MSTWTYLYRSDKKQWFMVIDLNLWRETSRMTQGFGRARTKEITERQLTKEEQKDYENHWRLYSVMYDTTQKMLNDERRIAGDAWAEKLNTIITEKVKQP